MAEPAHRDACGSRSREWTLPWAIGAVRGGPAAVQERRVLVPSGPARPLAFTEALTKLAECRIVGAEFLNLRRSIL